MQQLLTPEFIVFCLYLLVGSGAWTGYALAVISGHRKMLLLRRPPIPPIDAPATPLKVTIAIPAKDEGERIRACIESALSQDYPNFDVIAVNDRSTDNTGAVMDEMAREHPNLRVLHITEPPAEGWTGKNNALHQGSKIAAHSWCPPRIRPESASAAAGPLVRPHLAKPPATSTSSRPGSTGPTKGSAWWGT